MITHGFFKRQYVLGNQKDTKLAEDKLIVKTHRGEEFEVTVGMDHIEVRGLIDVRGTLISAISVLPQCGNVVKVCVMP